LSAGWWTLRGEARLARAGAARAGTLKDIYELQVLSYKFMVEGDVLMEVDIRVRPPSIPASGRARRRHRSEPPPATAPPAGLP